MANANTSRARLELPYSLYAYFQIFVRSMVEDGVERNGCSFPDDCLPSERDYTSRDAVFKAINSWAAPRGYAFQRSSYVNQINFGPEVDLIDSPRAQS
ncbi:hypothetical protein FNYG_14768 [Fusarium nygamai]|uniref:Uncharacterized protein n=1 Tax=Gibberella nygamai TaxID=42673 RepID=A0A2K0UQ53_GIBNY|nr:hypothetical protein FNYG_14768 [Fusarium nygamai]